MFSSIKNPNEVYNNLKSKGFRAFSLSTYDLSTLYTIWTIFSLKDWSLEGILLNCS